MDPQPADRQTTFDEIAEVVADEPSPGEKLKKTLLRISGVVVAAGLVVTLIGTGQLASSRQTMGDASGAHAIRSFGLMTLLVGAALALGSFRIPALARLMKAQPRGGSDGAGSAAAAPGIVVRLVSLLAFSVGLGIVSVVVLLILPAAIAGFYFTAMSFLLVTITVVGLLYGRPTERAFCVGATIPLSFSLLRLWILTTFSRTGPPWPRWQGGPDRLWPMIEQQLEWLFEVSEVVANFFSVRILLAWLSAIMLGCLAAGVRVLLFSHDLRSRSP